MITIWYKIYIYIYNKETNRGVWWKKMELTINILKNTQNKVSMQWNGGRESCKEAKKSELARNTNI